MAELDIKTFTLVASKLPASQAVLIRGPHGIGKSQLVKTIAADVTTSDGHGLPLVDRRLAQMTEGDIIGLPELVDGVTRFCPVDWILRACREPVVLLLDELNRATIEVQQCAFQLVLDRELNGNKLHPETRIFCAVNASPEYQVNEMDPALLDRFWTVDLCPTPEDWIEWAEGAGNINSVIIDFIRHYKSHLRHAGKIEPGKIYPTPRSWEKLDVALKCCGWDPEALAGFDLPSGFYALSTGFVGFEASLAFQDFVKNYDAQISAADILDKWEEKKDRVMKLSNDKHSSIIEKIISDCKKNEWGVDQAKNACTFIQLLSGEMLVSFFNSVLETNNVPNIRLVHKQLGPKVVTTVTAAEKI